MGEISNALARKSEGKRPLRKPRNRWEDNIRMDLREIGWGSVDWMHLAQDKDQWQALMNMIMNLWVPYKAGNFVTS
jgi:ribosome biogenesis protein Nip4